MDDEELKLERQRLRIDTRLRWKELKLKQEEAARSKKASHGWKFFLTPTGASIAAGIIALCGTAAGKWFDLHIENKKAETDIILKASDVPSSLDDATRTKVRARNIIWFYQAGYISVPNQKFLAQLYKDGQLDPNQIAPAPEVQSAVPATKSDGKSPAEMYAQMTIRPESEAAAKALAQKITLSKDRYEQVGAEFGIPWQIIGVMHAMESDCDFSRHLHNGDPLTARTKHVPAGRPTIGNPPFAWEDSARDAVRFYQMNERKDWSIAGALFFFEGFNGMGYRRHGINSPYLWGGSNQYTIGNYMADGRWSEFAVSRQVGVAPLLKELGYTGNQP